MKLFLLIFLSLPCYATKEEDAVKNAASAFYKQFGMEQMVDKFVKDTVPKKIQEVSKTFGPIADIIIRQKVEYKWTF